MYEANRCQHRQFLDEYKQLREMFSDEGASPAFILRIKKLLMDWMNIHVAKIDTSLKMG